MEFPTDIFQFITTQENAYKHDEVSVFDNFSWNMAEHIRTSVSFKHGKFLNASNDLLTKPPFKNIVLQVLRLRYRAEDVDVKDVTIYVENPEKYHLSFLVKKYFEDVFLVENDLDTFFDQAKEEKIDLGGCLVKKGMDAVPEVMPLQTVAFCDQTDIEGGPVGFKFIFSPGLLRSKAKAGWGDSKYGATISIEDLISYAKMEKKAYGIDEKPSIKTPGKNIEVYIVRGELPESYLVANGSENLINQVQVVAFYHTKDERKGQVLFRQKETEDVFKFHNPEKIFGRALGMGGVEELVDAQIWTNFAEIHKTNMLKSASKVVFWTDDDAYAARNKIKDMDNLEITTVARDSKGIFQVPTGSPNIQLFNQSLIEWQEYARDTGAATEPLLGKQPPAGTPFRLQERVVFEGKGLHDYRRGKFAKFIEEIFRDWIIPHIAKEIVKGKKFLSTLTEEEMIAISRTVIDNEANRMIKEKILNGELIAPEEVEAFKAKTMEEFTKNGNKKWVEILKDEFQDTPLAVKVTVAAKQKDLSLIVDKLVDVVRQYLATPLLRQDPVAIKLLNRILEWSGLSPVQFGEIFPSPMLPAGQMMQQGVPEQATRPIQEITRQREMV